MRTTKYLYDLDPVDFKYEPYYKALQLKLASARKLKATVVHLDVIDPRIKEIDDAIKHTEKLLAEVEYTSTSSHTEIDDFITPSVEESSKFC